MTSPGAEGWTAHTYWMLFESSRPLPSGPSSCTSRLSPSVEEMVVPRRVPTLMYRRFFRRKLTLLQVISAITQPINTGTTSRGDTNMVPISNHLFLYCILTGFESPYTKQFRKPTHIIFVTTRYRHRLTHNHNKTAQRKRLPCDGANMFCKALSLTRH